MSTRRRPPGRQIEHTDTGCVVPSVVVESPAMKSIHHSGDSDPTSILVVLPTWVGDFVMATPTLCAIRDRFRHTRITFLMEPNLIDLAGGGPWMDDFVVWPEKSERSLLRKGFRRLASDLRRRRFDWAVLLSNSFRSALLVRLAGIARRIGYDRDGRGFLLSDRLPVKNRRKDRNEGATRQCLAGAVSPSPFHPLTPVKLGANLPVPPSRFVPLPLTEYLADLAEAIGCPRPNDKLELFTTQDCDESVHARLSGHGVADRHPLVVVSPGAKYGAAKCWMPGRFAELCDRLIESQGALVLITCGPGEHSIARAIESAMNQTGVVLADPGLTLGEMKSLIRRCDLLISNDAGIRHFAKAFGVSVVTIFGPTHPEWTATSYELERIVRVDVDCGPCQQRTCPLGHLDCMDRVSVDMVYGACQDLIALPARVVAG